MRKASMFTLLAVIGLLIGPGVGSADAAPAATCPTGTAAVTATPIVATQGGTATVAFTIAAGCANIEVSLVSYKSTAASFDRSTADQQVLLDSKTQILGPGPHTLSVQVPNCFFQLDFVLGKPIMHLGPADSNNFYSDQGRLIENLNSGTGTCASVTTVTPPVVPPTVVGGFQAPPVSVGRVAPITETAPAIIVPAIVVPAVPAAPSAGRLPSTVAAPQLAPQVTVGRLPSTSTVDHRDPAPLAGALLVLAGLFLLRRYGTATR